MSVQQTPSDVRHESTHDKEPVKSLLLIDDDVDLCSLMEEFFRSHGFSIDFAHDGATGLAHALEGRHDVILLDVMLPVLDGFEVLEHLRRRSAIPVILLTARSDKQDRIAGLEAGADDYLPKPFGPRELLARVRAVLRRAEHTQAAAPSLIEAGAFKLNKETRRVWKNDHEIHLTSHEFDIFDVLVRSAGRVVSRDVIAAVLYHRESSPFERGIDVHMSHLRKKLESKGEVLIRSVRGVGYLFSPPEPLK